MINSIFLNKLNLSLKVLERFNLIWNFFELIFSDFYIFFIYFLNNFRVNCFHIFRWLLLPVFLFFYLFVLLLFFVLNLLNYFFLSFFKLSEVNFITLTKATLFFNFYEFKIYGYFVLPIFIFHGFKLRYNKPEKQEFFLVENYGNVSSIKYNLYEYPFRRLKFLDYRIKLLFDKINKFTFDPFFLKINKSIPPFSFDLNFFLPSRPPMLISTILWSSWLLFYYWPSNVIEKYLIVVVNFFFYYKFYCNYFGSICSVVFSFWFFWSFFLYFYYFLYKFFSLLKLFNLLTIKFLKFLIGRWFAFLCSQRHFFFKHEIFYYVFFIWYFLGTYSLFFFSHIKYVLLYIFDSLCLSLEFFVPKYLLYLKRIDYNFYLVICWNLWISNVIPFKFFFWNLFDR